MSTYLTMWQKIKELTKQETLDWINAVEPAKGLGIDFRGSIRNPIHPPEFRKR